MINFSSQVLFELLFRLSGFYKIYERWLESQISRDPLPKHVAIILDGNRRWAKYHFFGIDKAHFIGAEKAEELLNWIYDLEIKITYFIVDAYFISIDTNCFILSYYNYFIFFGFFFLYLFFSHL